MPVTVTAPAKINLGLEILGRRDDGYHEVRTILCALDLHDTLRFERADTDSIEVTGHDPGLPIADNLVARALAAARSAGAAIPPQRVTMDKRIPAAAGLGGASSDAAATLRAFRPEIDAAGGDTAAIAAALGSDVPFFLDGRCALASGRGERLAPLPAPTVDLWVVLVTPEIDIPAKTATMYGAVDPAWWSDGTAVADMAASLPSPPDGPPFNVFERALRALHPAIRSVPETMVAAGAPWAALTGAGPTWYTLLPHDRAATALADRLSPALGQVTVTRLAR